MTDNRSLKADTEISKEDALVPLAFAAWGVVMFVAAVALSSLSSSPLVLQMALLAP